MARRQRRSDEAFQMAPMIDMVFLLLVFFMTVSTLARDARPELDLPSSTTAIVPESAPPRNIITIRAEDDVFEHYWSNQRVSREDLSGLMESHDAGMELLLRASPGLPWSSWEEIIRMCRDIGIGDVTFATFEE